MARRGWIAPLAAACCVLAACSTHTAAGASVPPSRYVVCEEMFGICDRTTMKHAPAVLDLSGDGSLAAQGIRWTGWGTSVAVGHGTAEANNCTPSCADGKFSPHPITITVSKPKTWGRDMAYSSLGYSIPSLRDKWTITRGLIPTTAAAPPPSVTTPPAPAPVSTQATVSAGCVPGVYDITAGHFYSMTDLTSGMTTRSGDHMAEAYQLTLTDTSPSATAGVTGFAVVFYSGSGQELTSDQQTIGATFITPGQSLTWTEYPWGTSSAGQGASVGPFAAGETGAVDSAATCQLVQWYHS